MIEVAESQENMVKKEFLIYQDENEDVKVEVMLINDDLWLTQDLIAELFGTARSTITEHIHNILKDGELSEKTSVGISDESSGGRKPKMYNLDMIIAVGYRVNSKKATQFRIWATKILKEYMTKGFVLDDERLKKAENIFGKDYFRELLERIRSIRASERRIWQQVTDIFAECSIDYDKNSEVTKKFYAMVQNKFHYAITGSTAAEIVYQKENMGLTTWKHEPNGRILKSDAMIAKNYLSEKQIKRLERAVSGYFDYIEDLVERENIFTMEDFAKSINEFLEFRRFDILQNCGSISRKQAEEKAEKEYMTFNKTQRINSDFDKLLLESENLKR